MDSSASSCHRRSPSSYRFLGLFSFSPPFSSAINEELNEAEVFCTTTTNADDFTDPDDSTTLAAATKHIQTFKNSGILAVLPDSDRPAQVLYRKPSLSSPSKPIPSIPRPSLQSQSSDGGGQTQSARTTFSVLEGFGRTLKGRDLRQVRNAIWRKTGFLD